VSRIAGTSTARAGDRAPTIAVAVHGMGSRFDIRARLRPDTSTAGAMPDVWLLRSDKHQGLVAVAAVPAFHQVDRHGLEASVRDQLTSA
jgi:hypothetical protein